MLDADISITLVRLPSLWHAIARELWTVESAIGGAGFRDVARRTHAYSTDGTRHEVTCLAQHGLERRTMYGLFLEEMRARGWLHEESRGESGAAADGGTMSARATSPTTAREDDAGRAPPETYRRPKKQLFLVPAVPVPPWVNQSTRMLLSLGLQEATLKSVRANPPPAGSRGPNHFLIVARVCSCFISGDRRPHLGKRARDECQPFQRVGPTRGELTSGVRVLSWEQVTPLDRKWSTSPQASQRLPNFVVPYPSSLLGDDPAKGRRAPWALDTATWHKPVRVFAAFGMLSNLTRASPSELLGGFATHCAPAEQALLRHSSCYGKRCRFALRALLMQQLDAARVPPRERHRERSCLREGASCPKVMSLVFWAFHDGGEGVGKLGDRHKKRDEPLFASDVLAVYRVMLASTFCVHVGGDTPTRKSFIDAIVASCIPVTFQNDSVLYDSLPYADAIPYRDMVVHLPIMDELTSAYAEGRAAQQQARPHHLHGAKLLPALHRQASLVDALDAVPEAVIAHKRALLRRYAPLLSYPYPKMLSTKRGMARSTAGSEGETAVHAQRGPNAVTMAVERLAAAVAPEP